MMTSGAPFTLSSRPSSAPAERGVVAASRLERLLLGTGPSRRPGLFVDSQPRRAATNRPVGHMRERLAVLRHGGGAAGGRHHSLLSRAQGVVGLTLPVRPRRRADRSGPR